MPNWTEKQVGYAAMEAIALSDVWSRHCFLTKKNPKEAFRRMAARWFEDRKKDCELPNGTYYATIHWYSLIYSMIHYNF